MNLRPALNVEEALPASVDLAEIQLYMPAGAGAVQASARRIMDECWDSLRNFHADNVLAATARLATLLENDRVLDGDLADEARVLLVIGDVWRDDPARARGAASSLLRRTRSPRLHAVLLSVLRFCHWRTRDFQAFYELPPSPYSRSAQLCAPRVACLSIESAAEGEQLRFKLAERLAREAIDLSARVAGIDPHVALLSTCVMATIAYEMGAIDDADLLIRGRIPTLEQHGSIESACWGLAVAAKVAHARGNTALALLTWRRGADIGASRGWLRLTLRCMAEEVGMLVAEQHLELAKRVLARADAKAGFPHHGDKLTVLETWPLELAHCRLAMAQGAYTQARLGLARLRDAALHINHPALVARVTAVLVGALFADGCTQEAQAELLGVLQLGASAGLYRTFIDELPIIAPCLHALRLTDGARLGHLNPYISSLLSASGSPPTDRKKSLACRDQSELLSTKETIILRLIRMGLSNKSVARELRIAPETVKSHAKRIFIKLSTRTRAEAVARATELGLI